MEYPNLSVRERSKLSRALTCVDVSLCLPTAKRGKKKYRKKKGSSKLSSARTTVKTLQEWVHIVSYFTQCHFNTEQRVDGVSVLKRTKLREQFSFFHKTITIVTQTSGIFFVINNFLTEDFHQCSHVLEGLRISFPLAVVIIN